MIVRQNHAEAIAPHKVGISQVLQHVPHRPFPRGLRLRKLVVGQSVEHLVESRQSVSKDLEWIPRTEELQHCGGVGSGLFGGP
jgi:hypothetical protein